MLLLAMVAAMHKKKKEKEEQKFNPVFALIGLSATGPRNL